MLRKIDNVGVHERRYGCDNVVTSVPPGANVVHYANYILMDVPPRSQSDDDKHHLEQALMKYLKISMSALSSVPSVMSALSLVPG